MACSRANPDQVTEPEAWVLGVLESHAQAGVSVRNGSGDAVAVAGAGRPDQDILRWWQSLDGPSAVPLRADAANSTSGALALASRARDEGELTPLSEHEASTNALGRSSDRDKRFPAQGDSACVHLVPP